MSEYTPRNPDAYYGHPLGADLMKGAAYAPYFDSAGRFLVGRIVEEVIDSKWLAQHDAEVERAAAEKAWDRLAGEIRGIPSWWNSDEQCGGFDLQPLGSNASSEEGAYMEVRRVMTQNPYRREEA